MTWLAPVLIALIVWLQARIFTAARTGEDAAWRIQAGAEDPVTLTNGESQSAA